MWTTCPICGKGIVITWPQLYVYRRGEDYLCGEDCMIVYDTKQTRKSNEKGVEKEVAAKLTQEQREEALRIAASGGDPIAYLKKLGLHNPWASWSYIREKAGKKAEVTAVKEVPEVESDKPVPVEQAVQKTVESMRKFAKTMKEMSTAQVDVFRITGVETGLGSYTRGLVSGSVIYFRREITEGDVIEVAMTEDDWRHLAQELPRVLNALGVEV